ncbi:MAG: TonB-dependent receptor, partial [Chitinophagaceae bacterium]
MNTDVFQLNDVFTKYIGNHEITLGTQNSFKKYANGFSPAFQGVYRFNSLADFYASAEGTKAAVRYDLSYTLGGGEFPLVGPKSLELGVFLQDKWKIKDNFTVSYGVRADYTQFYNTFLYNPVVDTLTRFYNGIRANTGAAPNTAVQISPRIGYNWDVFSDQTLQFRGGTGLFQGAPPFVWISNQASNSGMSLFGQITDGTGFVFSPDVNAYRPTLSGGLSRSY